jgi:hypothetical protein
MPQLNERKAFGDYKSHNDNKRPVSNNEKRPFPTDEKKLPPSTTEKKDVVPPPTYQEAITSHPFTSRPRSIYAAKVKKFKKEILKTVSLEVESSPASIDSTDKSSTATKPTFVTLIWATAMKSHWHDHQALDDAKASIDRGRISEELVELPADSIEKSREDDTKSVKAGDSGWSAPTDWDAKFEILQGNEVKHKAA